MGCSEKTNYLQLSFEQLISATFFLKTDRVRTGHEKSGMSWNFIISFSRPGKSWNLGVSHGKSWKMMFIKKNKTIKFFGKENSKNIPKMKDDFQENGQI